MDIGKGVCLKPKDWSGNTEKGNQYRCYMPLPVYPLNEARACGEKEAFVCI